jgi:hypothetical protein
MSAPTDEAIGFLERLRPSGPWVLTAIAPDPTKPGQVYIGTTTAQEIGAARAFIDKYNGHRNLYYSVNPTRVATDRKATKTNIARIEFGLADCDPLPNETSEAAKARYRGALQTAGVPAPTFIVDSGNGLQLGWRLAAPIILPDLIADKLSGDAETIISDVEARFKAAMERLGTKAGTQNIDRILRLPGTQNLPNATKRKAGRVVCSAGLIEFNDGVHDLAAFPPPPKDEPKPSRGRRPAPPQELPQELRLMLALAGESPAGYQSRSVLFWAFVNAALRKGLDDYTIVDACCGAAPGSSIGDHVRENGGEPYVKEQIEHAINAAPQKAAGEGSVIRWVVGTLDKVWRQTEHLLMATAAPVYVRGGRLVQPLWRWEKSAGERDVLNMQFVPYNVPRLSDVVAHQAHIQFQKFDVRSKKWFNIDPPNDVIERLIVIGHWSFRTVIGLVNSPIMRRDGSLLMKEGYDPQTQLWYKSSGGINLPPIPDCPTRDDALAALEVLSDLVKGFPFEDGISRAAALAGLMTPVLRAALDIAPLFLITAPEPRTGKTKLVQVCAVLATGHNPVATAGSERPEEMEKRIETAAMSGRPILHFNNLPNGMTLGSPGLSQILTEGVLNVRILGAHEEGTCDCRATTVFANGNNVSVSEDLVPRTVAVRLDAQSEHPEERAFEFDPVDRVREDRGKYLAAVFTIAKAFMAAGCPKPEGTKMVVGFAEWSRLVQQPLMWLGQPDPLGNRETLRAMDGKEQELAQLLGVLSKYHQELRNGFTTADLAKLADDWDRGGHQRPDLHELMCREGKIDKVHFGKLLTRQVGRRRNGWRIVLARARHNVSAFKLEGPEDVQQGDFPV